MNMVGIIRKRTESMIGSLRSHNKQRCVQTSSVPVNSTVVRKTLLCSMVLMTAGSGGYTGILRTR